MCAYRDVCLSRCVPIEMCAYRDVCLSRCVPIEMCAYRDVEFFFLSMLPHVASLGIANSKLPSSFEIEIKVEV